MRVFLIIAGIVALLIAAPLTWIQWWPHDELTAAGLHTQSGSITSGEKFGLRPGMTWREADRVVRAQFEPDYILWWTGTEEEKRRGAGHIHNGSPPLLTGRAEVTYRDRSWRNGVLTLDLVEGVVTEVSWNFAGPFYIDA